MLSSARTQQLRWRSLVSAAADGSKFEVPSRSDSTFSSSPLPSAELAKLCKERLGWSRTTTYTVIHRLGERGIVKNENGLVSSLVSKDEAQAAELDELVEKTFEGSLPAFIAAFARKTKLSQDEVDRLRAMIDGYEEKRP